MTIRTAINEKKRVISLFIHTGFAVFTLGMFITQISGHLQFISLVGFVVAFFTAVYAFFGIRCPKCNGQIGYIAMYLGTPFSMSKKIKYCSFCGVNVDTKLKEQ